MQSFVCRSAVAVGSASWLVKSRMRLHIGLRGAIIACLSAQRTLRDSTCTWVTCYAVTCFTGAVTRFISKPEPFPCQEQKRVMMHSGICRSSITRRLVSLSGTVCRDSASASVRYSVQRLGQRLCPVQCAETRPAPLSGTVCRDSASTSVRYSVRRLGQHLCPVQCPETRPAPLSGTVSRDSASASVRYRVLRLGRSLCPVQCTGTRPAPLSGTVYRDSASTYVRYSVQRLGQHFCSVQYAGTRPAPLSNIHGLLFVLVVVCVCYSRAVR